MKYMKWIGSLLALLLLLGLVFHQLGRQTQTYDDLWCFGKTEAEITKRYGEFDETHFRENGQLYHGIYKTKHGLFDYFFGRKADKEDFNVVFSQEGVCIQAYYHAVYHDKKEEKK